MHKNALLEKYFKIIQDQCDAAKKLGMFIHKEETTLCYLVDTFVRTQVPSPTLHILGPLCRPGHVLFRLFLEVPRSSSRKHPENCSIPTPVRLGFMPECLHSSSPDLLLHKPPKLRKLSSSSFSLCFWVPFWDGLC